MTTIPTAAIEAAVKAWYDNSPAERPTDWPSPHARMTLALEAALLHLAVHFANIVFNHREAGDWTYPDSDFHIGWKRGHEAAADLLRNLLDPK